MREQAKRRLRKAFDYLSAGVSFFLRIRNKPNATIAADTLDTLRNGLPERDDPTIRDRR